MITRHKIFYKSASNLQEIEDSSVSLVITSPPYPMIEMWDEVFSQQNEDIKKALQNQDGRHAFELMHALLDSVWDEMDRVLVPGGIICINIGDATRTINNQFQLYPSHSRVIQHFQGKGYHSLPEILWRKQTNAPNKFMGSGMLPPGAYVTLEHEFILLFRKGGKREIADSTEKGLRKESAFFWEERNNWFSDIWDFKGITQTMENGESRKRSAAFPFELAYRLINMFSLKEETILDPFLGTGTSMLAAMASCRNSIGVEIDKSLEKIIGERLKSAITFSNEYIENRLKAHVDFVNNRLKNNKEMKYMNQFFKVPVMTGQETELKIFFLKSIKKVSEVEFEVEYDTNSPRGNTDVIQSGLYSYLQKPQRNKGLFEWV
ncbi:MAG: site-specific DNA-methyltransferase [Candidatus Sigynarchaeota archaeon]